MLSKESLHSTVLSVDLSNNQLMSLPPSLRKLAKLRILNLRDNEFTELNVEDVIGFTEIQTLDIRGNPFKCVKSTVEKIRQINPVVTIQYDH